MSATSERTEQQDRRFLPLLPGYLFRAGQPALYVARTWALSLAGSVLLAAALSVASPAAEQPQFAGNPLWIAFGVVVFAPVIETALLTILLWPLDRLFGPCWAAVLAAAAWGVLHSSVAAIWGLVIWWPFLLFSVTILTWRREGGWVKGWALATAVHALQNLGPAVLLLSLG